MPPFDIECTRPWLVAQFSQAQRMVSWSLNRPGLVDASKVAWRQVGSDDLMADLDPIDWFAQKLEGADLSTAVGMMTSRDVETFAHHTARVENVEAHCVVTLGLNNGEHIGRRADIAHAAGTINILCHVSTPLTDAALLEAASLVAQARTVALMEAGYVRPGFEAIVTGTGTDCIVMAAPISAECADYAGMHTAIGEAVGACVLAATKAALQQWLSER
ncbi:MAG TPA: adenosylcobinamide amidohydrolase [Ancylobacter sp.]